MNTSWTVRWIDKHRYSEQLGHHHDENMASERLTCSWDEHDVNECTVFRKLNTNHKSLNVHNSSHPFTVVHGGSWQSTAVHSGSHLSMLVEHCIWLLSDMDHHTHSLCIWTMSSAFWAFASACAFLVTFFCFCHSATCQHSWKVSLNWRRSILAVGHLFLYTVLPLAFWLCSPFFGIPRPVSVLPLFTSVIPNIVLEFWVAF